MQKATFNHLMRKFGTCFSDQLGINLKETNKAEIFKWFLASILFGARISETIAMNTYKQFLKDGLVNANQILKTGWDGLVNSLDNGGYVRYDFKTADKLLEVMKNLKQNYKGNLNKLHEQAADSKDLEKKLKELGKGIGDVTVNIFLRELREIWEKANPIPQDLVTIAAYNLGFIKQVEKTFDNRVQILNELQNFWNKNKIKNKRFADFEVALLRVGKDFCRKNKCAKCELAKYCVRK